MRSDVNLVGLRYSNYDELVRYSYRVVKQHYWALATIEVVISREYARLHPFRLLACAPVQILYKPIVPLRSTHVLYGTGGIEARSETASKEPFMLQKVLLVL